MSPAASSSRLGSGIVQIRVPMEGSPLGHVNAYLLDDDGGPTLIDCGWKTDAATGALLAALAGHGVTPPDIRRLVITHAHYDHYGAAGTLLRAGVQALLMTAAEWRFADEHLRDPAAFDAECDAWIARNGFALDVPVDESELHHHRTERVAPTRIVADGERIGRLRAIATPGHTPGHLCFVDETTQQIFTGDHVLDPITPHVGLWREERGDPLGDYVASLERLRGEAASGVLPAHGEPFDDLHARVEALLAHEREREARVVAALRDGASSAGDVARALTWTRRERAFADLGVFHQQFAVAETLAHLAHLQARGVALRDDAGPVIRYALKRAA